MHCGQRLARFDLVYEGHFELLLLVLLRYFLIFRGRVSLCAPVNFYYGVAVPIESLNIRVSSVVILVCDVYLTVDRRVDIDSAGTGSSSIILVNAFVRSFSLILRRSASFFVLAYCRSYGGVNLYAHFLP